MCPSSTRRRLQKAARPRVSYEVFSIVQLHFVVVCLSFLMFKKKKFLSFPFFNTHTLKKIWCLPCAPALCGRWVLYKSFYYYHRQIRWNGPRYQHVLAYICFSSFFLFFFVFVCLFVCLFVFCFLTRVILKGLTPRKLFMYRIIW